jgi:diphosphomevalonate decarboxylase
MTCDTFYFEGIQQTKLSRRMEKVLNEVRRRTKDSEMKFVEIRSHNTFPASSGLASSASAYASLAIALTNLFHLDNPQSTAAYLARIGSGSAVRSVYGGFVRWSSEGECLSSCIYPAEHWSELRIIILIFNSNKKPVSSTDAMQRTRKTSTLFQARLATVNEKIERLIQAIQMKDFNTFAEIVMKDSSQFHAVCMDTYPPVIYLNEQSKHLIDLVHAYNQMEGMKVAYTFDAGPNPFCFIREEHVKDFLRLLNYFYPTEQGSNVDEKFSSIKLPIMVNALERIVRTKIGSGPKIIS